jgi:hypothetical protein
VASAAAFFVASAAAFFVASALAVFVATLFAINFLAVAPCAGFSNSFN